MKSPIAISSTFFLILLSGCQVVDPVSTPEAPPGLSRAIVPDTLRLGDADGMRIAVRVSDPQKIGEVGSVRVFVFAEGNPAPVLNDTLRDDGADGDILPGDGEHTGRIRGTDIGGKAGKYRVGFLAIPRIGIAGDTLFSGFQAVEGTSSSAPVIFQVIAPDSLSKQDLVSVRLSLEAGDPDGNDDIDSVFCDVYPPFQPRPVIRLAMTDFPPPEAVSAPFPAGRIDMAPSGRSGDLKRLIVVQHYDYTGDLSEVLAVSGSYAFRFQARDKAGLFSLPRVAHVMLTLPNQPPVLSELTAPDSVSRRNSETILLSVRVTDPQGQADIRRVYFNSFKPDGTPGSGNPFSMYDDGTNGDVIPGDGLYSRGIMISVSNALGNYRFDFHAEDRAGSASDALTHVIKVTDQIPD